MKRSIMLSCSILLLAAAAIAQGPEASSTRFTEDQAHAILGAGTELIIYTGLSLNTPKYKREQYKTVEWKWVRHEVKTSLISIAAATVVNGLFEMAKAEKYNRPFDRGAMRFGFKGTVGSATVRFVGRSCYKWIIHPLIKGDVKLTTLKPRPETYF